MEFEEQIKDLELFIDTTPRVYIKWNNTESGRDKNDCYERISNGYHAIYINTNNRNNIITQNNKFWNVLESLYNKVHL